ncbi:MAG TPA: hypothetical protein VGP79_02905, partial [Bryobacteraceae bacterium]|nr:hypothetical protein [Bryobacteraceae bacterium]
MITARWVTALVLCSSAFAQSELPMEQRTAVEWAAALGGRFQQLRNPAVARFALGQLASAVCVVDKSAGSNLYRQALTGLDGLRLATFQEGGAVLPVASFTGLWKSLMPAAVQCDPGFATFAGDRRIQAAMDAERQQARDNLARASAMIESRPDRAAQLAESAIEASDPVLLDVTQSTLFLSSLRDRAADLADNVFPKVLDAIANVSAPSTARLAELGKYLFIDPRLIEKPDKEQAETMIQAGGSSFPNLMAARYSANSEDIQLYIDAVLRVITTENASNADPIIGYALGYQMLPKARDLGFDSADKLEKAMQAFEAQAAIPVAQIQSALRQQATPRESREAGVRRHRAVAHALEDARGGRFPQARDALSGMDNPGIRGQVAALIDFAEAARAVQTRDFALALRLANGQRPGVKRILLYAAIMTARQEKISDLLPLAARDAERLPAEVRMLTLSAIAAAVFLADGERALVTLGEVIEATNDASQRPRRERFNPKIVSAIYSGAADTTTDAALILFGR